MVFTRELMVPPVTATCRGPLRPSEAGPFGQMRQSFIKAAASLQQCGVGTVSRGRVPGQSNGGAAASHACGLLFGWDVVLAAGGTTSTSTPATNALQPAGGASALSPASRFPHRSGYAQVTLANAGCEAVASGSDSASRGAYTTAGFWGREPPRAERIPPTPP
jgi:hypothetical protein